MTIDSVLRRYAEIGPGLAEVYQDLHRHPELSFEEHRTAALIAGRLTALGLEVAEGVGRTGVVGVLRNGEGPTVLLRADMDALPVSEQTGLPYASQTDGVMHACGHDMHVACLLGAVDLLAGARQDWSGTVLAVFQPAEERASGAREMVADKLFDRFGRPDVVLGQHVAPAPVGWIGAHAGPAFAATDSLRVTMFGRGGHGSRPETTVDPVVMAAATVMRLQTVVSREVAASDMAVVTVGSIQAGTKDNVIPDDAELKINIRSYTEPVRKTLLAAIERIVRGEAAASGAVRDPQITTIDTFPVLVNDPAATDKTLQAFRDHFGGDVVIDPGPVSGSEDVGEFATAAGVPLCYWIFGGIEHELFAQGAKEVPANHSPLFAPVIEPTLETGVAALTVAALTWLD